MSKEEFLKELVKLANRYEDDKSEILAIYVGFDSARDNLLQYGGANFFPAEGWELVQKGD